MAHLHYRPINATRERLKASAESQRMSEVSWVATQIQEQTKCSRTEALQAAERQVPHYDCKV